MVQYVKNELLLLTRIWHNSSRLYTCCVSFPYIDQCQTLNLKKDSTKLQVTKYLSRRVTT